MMIPLARIVASFPRVAALVEPHFDFLRKAMSFAAIGVVNVVVDTAVFFTAWYVAGVLAPLPAGDEGAVRLAAANVMSWAVAVTGSYVMNSTITFAAESGRKLRWRDYATFATSGLLGLGANTAALLLAAQVMPVLPAKLCAIFTSFVVNFGMSHFVVFRPRAAGPDGS